MQAVKFGTKFVETLIRVLPLWEPHFQEMGDSLKAVLKKVQKGTRQLQHVCSDSKARANVALTARVRSTALLYLSMTVFDAT